LAWRWRSVSPSYPPRAQRSLHEKNQGLTVKPEPERAATEAVAAPSDGDDVTGGGSGDGDSAGCQRERREESASCSQKALQSRAVAVTMAAAMPVNYSRRIQMPAAVCVHSHPLEKMCVSRSDPRRLGLVLRSTCHHWR
jgi:hypothetical protein